jgi:hypothetical protein
LCTRQPEEQEENCADELAAHGDEVVADAVWYTVYEGEAQVGVAELGIGVRGFGEGEGQGAALNRLLVEASV